ncbi:N-acetyltransferase family protein [Altererythrobacter sp.]|uniref:GNAT family N-acetyltransferase n=1 Tax=Altererythrobacter sp. TaxID=1872480 RepID=UPI003D068601
MLRPFRDADAEALATVIRSAIETIGPHAYSPEQVAAWSARHPRAERFRERAADGATIILASDDHDDPVAYALLEPDGHLDHLYCHPDHTRRGLAVRLLEAADAHARSSGITRLYTEASELARPAFERAGYTASHRRDFDLDGVAIHNYAMEKALT